MTKFLIYLFPALMDLVIGAVLFICPTRLAQNGQKAIIVTSVASVWAIAYMTTSHFIGKFLSRSNAAAMLMGSCIVIALLCGCFVLLPGLTVMFVLMGLIGIATAFFFSPFQVFMKAVGGDHDGGVVQSTALYTFSWSAGMAAGPFISGYLWEATSWQMCFGVMAAASVFTAIGIYLLKHHAQSHPHQQPESTELESGPVVANRYEKMPDLAYMGWIVAGLGIMVNLMVRSLLPKTGEILGLAKTQTGNILFLLSGTQATVGLLMIRSKFWMFKKLPCVIFNICGMAALAMFALCKQASLLYVAAVLGGIYTGAMYFSFVFHSLIHPKKAGKYVAVNESIVGLCGIIGPVAGGMIVSVFAGWNLPMDFMPDKLPYALSILVIMSAIIIQLIILTRNKQIRPIIDSSTLSKLKI